MECENLYIHKGLNITGVNGRPRFNCGQNCKSFLTVPFIKSNSSNEGQAVVIKNLELRNSRCKKSPINVFKSIKIRLDNVFIRHSDFPSISVHQLDKKPVYINVDNCNFLSANGIQITKFDNLFLWIDNCQFAGDGSNTFQGIIIDNRGKKRKETGIHISIKLTTFTSLAAALTLSSFSVNLMIFVQNSVFLNNKQGKFNKYRYHVGSAFCLYRFEDISITQRFQMYFLNVTFKNNTSGGYGIGGAVQITTLTRKIRKHILPIIRFTRCHFISNKALWGGAISVMHHQPCFDLRTRSSCIDGPIQFYKCIFINNSATNPHKIMNKTSPYNAQGGAIGCQRFQVRIFETLMVNNYADHFGGSIVDNDCLFFMANTTIRIDESISHMSLEGQVIYTKSVYFMYNVTIDVTKVNIQSTRNPYTFFSGSSYGLKAPTAIVVPRNVKFRCFSGSNIELTTAMISPRYGGGISLMFRCIPCPINFYSLGNSYGILLNGRNVIKHDIRCLPCPYGGKCLNGITAQPNFWGYKSEAQGTYKIRFLPCPTGYCCQEKNCSKYDSCNKNREGVMCGRCRKGFSQTVSSLQCIERNKCSSNGIIWLMMLFGGLGYIFFLMYLQEISCILKKLLSWKREEVNKTLNENRDTSKIANGKSRMEVNEDCVFSGLIKVIFFFAQIEPMIRIDSNTLITNYCISMAKSITSTASNILNFQISVFCAFKTATPIMNKVLAITFPIILLVILGIVTSTFYFIRFARKQLSRIVIADNNLNFNVRLVSCLVNIILLTYATMTKTSLTLLNCAEINHSRVLYLDGTFTCYATWQYILVGFAMVFIVPLPFSLAQVTRKLEDHRITVSKCLFYLLFPFAALLDMIASCIQSCLHRCKATNVVDTNKIDPLPESEPVSASHLPDAQNAEVVTMEPVVNIKGESVQHFDEMQEKLADEVRPCGSGLISLSVGSKTRISSQSWSQRSSSQSNKIGNKLKEMKERNRLEKVVLNVVEGPFLNSKRKRKICWESVLIARRLLVISVFTFVPYPTIRMLSILILILVMIIHSTYRQPYNSKFVNRCEAISLFVLAVLCLINTIVTYSHESNSHLSGCLKHLPESFMFIEAILTAIIPLTTLFIIFTLIVLKLLFTGLKICFSKLFFTCIRINNQSVEGYTTLIQH